MCTWDGCGKRFTEYSSLYKHHVVHTHTKPYECADCGKTYRQTSTLAIHRRMAHGENSHAESTTLVQSAATAFIVTSNTLCNRKLIVFVVNSTVYRRTVVCFVGVAEVFDEKLRTCALDQKMSPSRFGRYGSSILADNFRLAAHTRFMNYLMGGWRTSVT